MKFVARNLQPSVLTLVADSGASAFSSKALLAWVTFYEASSSPLHPTGQKRLRGLPPTFCHHRNPHLASRSRRCLRRGARTNAIPSSCWKSVHKESSFRVYALSTSETSNLPSIQLYEHENRHRHGEGRYNRSPNPAKGAHAEAQGRHLHHSFRR